MVLNKHRSNTIYCLTFVFVVTTLTSFTRLCQGFRFECNDPLLLTSHTACGVAVDLRAYPDPSASLPRYTGQHPTCLMRMMTYSVGQSLNYEDCIHEIKLSNIYDEDTKVTVLLYIADTNSDDYRDGEMRNKHFRLIWEYDVELSREDLILKEELQEVVIPADCRNGSQSSGLAPLPCGRPPVLTLVTIVTLAGRDEDVVGFHDSPIRYLDCKNATYPCSGATSHLFESPHILITSLLTATLALYSTCWCS